MMQFKQKWILNVSRVVTFLLYFSFLALMFYAYKTSHPDCEVIQNGSLFLNHYLPFLTFCGHLVRSGRFLANHHARQIQEGCLAHLQRCGCAGCAENLILSNFRFYFIQHLTLHCTMHN